MTWETHPVALDRFEDFADVINRSRRANHCWCLSHRLRTCEIEEIGGGSREQAMRRLCEPDHPPGVVTYRDGEPVGLCNIGPCSEIPRLAGSRFIRPVDDLPVWSIVCLVVRSASSTRRDGSPPCGCCCVCRLAWCARRGGASGRPSRSDGPDHGVRGTKSMFERVGFRVVGSTDAVASGMPRLDMRRDLA